MMIPLSACAAEYSIGRSGFPKRSLLKRERETNGCVFRSPQQKQGKKREKTTHFDFTQRKEVQKRGKKNESTAKTYRRKKEKELKRKREREKESVFLEKRETFFLLSLSPFSDFGGRSELKSRQTFFVSPRDTDLISLSILLLHVTMK
jgi:hypothetical protein